MTGNNSEENKVQAALRKTEDEETTELSRIFEQHQRRVLQAAYRVTGNQTDAEDVLQTVFLRLLRRDRRPEKLESMGSYLHRAAVNAAIDLLRSRKSRPDVALERVGPDLIRSQGAGPEDRQTVRELQEWLRSAISKLSPQSAEVFVLRYLEGCDNQEIARMIHTSPGVVAVVLHRTRARLRDELQSYLGGLR